MSNRDDKLYISDPKLVPRIRMFLESRDPHATVIPESVLQHLQATYSDYARKKKNAFRHTVSKALQVARKEVFGPAEAKPKGAKKRRQESSSDSDPEGLVAYEDSNSLNIALRNLYKNTNANKIPSTPKPDQHKKSVLKKMDKTAASAKKENPSSLAGLNWVVDRNGSRGMNLKRGKNGMEQGQNDEHAETGGASENVDEPSAWNVSFSYTCTCGVRRTVDLSDGQTQSSSSAVSKNWAVSCPYTCTCGVQRVMNITDELKSSFETQGSSILEKNNRIQNIRLKAVLEADSDAPVNSDGKSDSSTKKKKLKRKRTKTDDLDRDTDPPDVEPIIPSTTLNDFGGNNKLLMELHRDFDEFLYSDFCHFASGSDMKTCRRYLLHGPRGSGKRFLAECIAGQLKLPFLKPKINTLISGVSGDSEQRVRDLFEQAATQAPCVLYLEDIECLAPRQDTPGGSKDMMTRIASELGSCIDDLQERPENIVLIATTSRIESVHKDLRIPGRFIEKALGMPDEKSRESLLQKLCRKYTISPDLSLRTLARLTPGFVVGDLRALVHDAFSTAFLRVRNIYRTMSADDTAVKYPPPPEPPAHLAGKDIVPCDHDRTAMALTEEDFMGALKKAQPAAKREGFATVPTTTWEDVGALQNVRAQLQDSILCRIHDPEMASAFGLPTNSGIILVGPPGCGKTLVAKAMANEAGLNFMYIKGPELLDKYVGESERNLREKFDKAQTCAPCLIFFDEMDTLCSNRQSSEGSNVGKSVTNQLLALMDGCGERNQVYVMGATNIIENVDPALQRPGRFDRKIFIGLPSAEGRLDILRALTKGGSSRKLVSCDLQQFAQETEGFSGADLKHLVDEASTIAMKESMRDIAWRENSSREYVVTGDHFSRALQLVKPSVMKKDAEKYHRVSLQM